MRTLLDASILKTLRFNLHYFGIKGQGILPSCFGQQECYAEKSTGGGKNSVL